MGKIKTMMGIVTMLFLVVIASLAINVFLLKNNVVIFQDLLISDDSVIISKSVKGQLDNIYLDAEVEIPTCLAGDIDESGNLKIIDIMLAGVVNQTESSCVYVECPAYIGSNKVIGTLHNHPNGYCRLSDQDIQTYVGDMDRGHEVIGIYCGDGYVFYVLAEIPTEVEQ